jgi:hypothetical protein
MKQALYLSHPAGPDIFFKFPGYAKSFGFAQIGFRCRERFQDGR